MKKKPTLQLVLDTRNKSKLRLDQREKARYPISMRVFFAGRKRFYSIGYKATEIEWDQLNTKTRLDTKLREIKIAMTEAEHTAFRAVGLINTFSFQEFKSLFLGIDSETLTVYQVYDLYIEKLKNEDKFSTAETYEHGKRSFMRFKKSLYFDEVTESFLKNYEKHLQAEKKSVTTISIYMRTLKAVFNYAITKKYISKDQHYPFGRHAYVIPQTKSRKIAISQSDIAKIANYHCDRIGTFQEEARDLFLISYLLNGINMHDLLSLRYEQIQDRTLTYVRSKTRNKTGRKTISIYLHERALEIINRWGQKKINEDTLVFPYLEGIDDIETMIEKKRRVISKTNKWIKQIAKDLSIQKEITTYTARHSFAMTLKYKGASIELISESLGHTNVLITESYLGSFSSEVKKEVSGWLL